MSPSGGPMTTVGAPHDVVAGEQHSRGRPTGAGGRSRGSRGGWRHARACAPPEARCHRPPRRRLRQRLVRLEAVPRPETELAGPVRAARAAEPGEWSRCVWVTTMARRRPPAVVAMASRCPASSGPGSMATRAVVADEVGVRARAGHDRGVRCGEAHDSWQHDDRCARNRRVQHRSGRRLGHE